MLIKNFDPTKQFKSIKPVQCPCFKALMFQSVDASKRPCFKALMLRNVHASKCWCFKTSMLQSGDASKRPCFKALMLQNVNDSKALNLQILSSKLSYFKWSTVNNPSIPQNFEATKRRWLLTSVNFIIVLTFLQKNCNSFL